MKSLLVCSLLIISYSVSYADNDKCQNDFKEFRSCVKQQRDQQPEAVKQQQEKEHQQKCDQCFAQNQCDGPNWAADSNPSKGKQGFNSAQMPEAVKQCMKRKMIQKAGEQVNECLSRHHVKNVNISDYADQGDHEGGGKGDKNGIKSHMSANIKIVTAVDACCQKKGGDTNSVKPLEQCLYKVKRDEKPRKCAEIKPCQAKGKRQCQKRGEDIHKALCLCKKEKEAEASKKLRSVVQGKQSVPAQEVMKAFAGDQDASAMMNNLNACYAESNQQPPLFLQYIMKFLGGSGGSTGGSTGGKGLGAFGGSRMSGGSSVSASSVIIMCDMLDMDVEDKSDCEPCP